MLLVTFSLVFAAASGCISAKDDPPVEAQADDASMSEMRPADAKAPEPAPEPSASAPAASAAPASEDAGYAASSLATLALAFDGATQPFLCIPSALPACGAALPSETERYVPEYNGAPRSVRAMLEWSAASPLTETLVLHIEGIEGCHEECHVMGTSPLELNVDGIALAEEWELTIHAFVPCQVCDGHDKMMDPGQEFSISGELVYAPYDEA